MGILNVTPDSFSDGGRYSNFNRAVDHALSMIEAGAGIVDVGGESTRPGAQEVDETEELRRVIPVVEALVARTDVPISVDTSKAAVIRAAIAAGATMVNDVRALQDEAVLGVVAQSTAAVCLMHMQGEPRTMQASPHYENVVTHVRDFLAARVAACEAAGIARQRIVVDPGIGFGKRAEHNIRLLSAIPELLELRLPDPDRCIAKIDVRCASRPARSSNGWLAGLQRRLQPFSREPVSCARMTWPKRSMRSEWQQY